MTREDRLGKIADVLEALSDEAADLGEDNLAFLIDPARLEASSKVSQGGSDP